HLFQGIVKTETGTHRARDLVEIHDGLGTMVPGPDGNSQFVQNGPYVIGVYPFNVKGYHSGLRLGRSIDLQSLDSQQLLGGMFKEPVLIMGNGIKTDPVHIVQGGPKGDPPANIRGPRLKLVW